jgi:hypothetical protein
MASLSSPKPIKIVFNPINFIGNFARLFELITEFNNYLIFDDWKVELSDNKKEIICQIIHTI